MRKQYSYKVCALSKGEFEVLYMSKLWKTLYKGGQRMWTVLPFLSFLVHKRDTRPSEDYATGFFSSQQDYKMLYEVLVCFMPASNGKWGLQPSLL